MKVVARSFEPSSTAAVSRSSRAPRPAPRRSPSAGRSRSATTPRRHGGSSRPPWWASPLLLAVPNVSEGRDRETLDAIGAAFVTGGARLLDVHSDPHHHRSVFTLAGEPGALHEALLEGAREAVERIDLTAHSGLHPRVGVLDVAPIVHRTDAERGAAVAEALLLAHRLGRDLGLPVYLYGAPAVGCSCGGP